MNKWPKQNPAAMNAFYGDPDVNNDLTQDLDWAVKNLTQIVPPYPMFYAGKPVKLITCHVKVADSLKRILGQIGEAFDAAERKQYGLDEYGGVNNFRAKRSNPDSLSVHSWACAIDLSPTINAFRVKYGSRPNMMPPLVVDFFEAEGWTWGGPWSNGDAMHFQAADIG